MEISTIEQSTIQLKQKRRKFHPCSRCEPSFHQIGIIKGRWCTMRFLGRSAFRNWRNTGWTWMCSAGTTSTSRSFCGRWSRIVCCLYCYVTWVSFHSLLRIVQDIMVVFHIQRHSTWRRWKLSLEIHTQFESMTFPRQTGCCRGHAALPWCYLGSGILYYVQQTPCWSVRRDLSKMRATP